MDENNQILRIAISYAKETLSEKVTPAHLLKALLHKDTGLIGLIEKINKDYYYILEWTEVQISHSPKSTKIFKAPLVSEKTEAVIREAKNYQIKYDYPELDPIFILAAVVTPGVGFTFEQLKSLLLTPEDIFIGLESKIISNDKKTNTSINNVNSKFLDKFCINKNNNFQIGLIDTVVGFEKEIVTIFEVLGRKNKSNLLITGESGVGKTSLINCFIQNIVEGNVPSFLTHSIVYELDLGSILTEANYKGEIEDRFKNVINEIKKLDDAILLIESVDKVMDKQGALYSISNILKQELNKGNILLICTSSIDGYTKNIEIDKEFVYKFEKITIQEPNFDQCFRILKGAIENFEKYHNLTISNEVIIDAIRLSKRYMNEKSLPDSVFDLLDRTMSLIKTTNEISKNDLITIQNKLNDLKTNFNNIKDENLITELSWIHFEIFNKISSLLTVELDEESVDFLKIDKPAKIEYLESIINRLLLLSEGKRTTVQNSDLFAVIAKQTGIPIGKVQSKERDKLLNAESTLKKRVVGQDHAMKIILDAVYESRAGLNKKGQSMGAFFFLGPTGTGKTEMAKALAEFLFLDESAMIRFDMSEFKEEHSVALLIGAPPGYVGYEEGGLLVNQIRQKPYSVVLFDEIEKAHRSVFDIFLQIIDEGKLHDRLGRTGYFSNALILFTSNIGSQFIIESFNKEIIPKSNDLLEIMQGHFRPEFLGRLTEIVPFSPITENIVTMIFDIHLKGLLKLLEEQNISLVIDDIAKREIALSGFNAQFGARPIIGMIRKELRRPLSKLIISGELVSGSKIELKYLNGEFKWIY